MGFVFLMKFFFTFAFFTVLSMHWLFYRQISHGHSGITERVGINVTGNTGFSSNINGVGGSIPGFSSGAASVGNHNSIPGLGVNPILGNLGPRISSSAGNISAGGNIGRSINSGGPTISSLAARTNLAANSGSGTLNLQGPNRLMGGMLQQGWDLIYWRKLMYLQFIIIFLFLKYVALQTTECYELILALKCKMIASLMWI